MLLLLDQEEMVRINKTRISSQYNDYQICVDDVENLGSFIEVEVLIPDADADKSDQVQEELFTFLTSLGISPDDRATVGYNTLLLAKKNEKQSWKTSNAHSEKKAQTLEFSFLNFIIVGANSYWSMFEEADGGEYSLGSV